jgi:hypothetical protein
LAVFCTLRKASFSTVFVAFGKFSAGKQAFKS